VTTSASGSARRKPSRFSLSPARLAGYFWQVIVVALAIAVLLWLWSNAVHNLSARRISTGFAFLSREAGMPIADALVAYSPQDTYLRAFIVGVVNTLRVAVIGIVLATVLGTLIGIARLSSNWLLSRMAAVYVEVLRDIPLLLQLLFWYVLMQGLPAARAAWMPIGGVFLSNRGLVLPSIPIEGGHLWVIGTAVLGLIASEVLRRRFVARQLLDGTPRSVWPYVLFPLVGLPALVSWGLGVAWTIDMPRLRGFNFVG
jgi:general L-amino acid transport system permease protein